jgi:hypothetical protein
MVMNRIPNKRPKIKDPQPINLFLGLWTSTFFSALTLGLGVYLGISLPIDWVFLTKKSFREMRNSLNKRNLVLRNNASTLPTGGISLRADLNRTFFIDMDR